MSISVDDSGSHRLPDYDPTPAAELDAAFALWTRGSTSSHTPARFVNALRTGTPGARYTVTVDGVHVEYTLTEAGAPPFDTTREQAAWQELCDTVATVISDGIHASLPAELATATWARDGQQITGCRPGTPAGALRRALRHRLAALSPLPLLGALCQPFAGSATAVGIALAPVLPVDPHPGPIPAIDAREPTGDVYRPEPAKVDDILNWGPGQAVNPPRLSVTSQSSESATADVASTSEPVLAPTHEPSPLAEPQPTLTVTPASPAPTPSPTQTTTATPAGPTTLPTASATPPRPQRQLLRPAPEVAPRPAEETPMTRTRHHGTRH